MKELILASGSPRRREYMENFSIPFTVIISGCDESMPEAMTPVEGVKEVAARKARDVASKNRSSAHVLAADTIVLLDNEIMGKPSDEADAAGMLSRLSGRTHEVITGVAIANNGKCKSITVTTKVKFINLTPEMIKWYISSGEPFDKAGAYGIQGLAGAFVEAIEGSYSNVVGLPLAETLSLLGEAGYSPWQTKQE